MKAWFKGILALGLFSLVSAMACAPPEEKKQEDKFIFVKGMFDLTGGTADVGVSYSKGVLDSIREINEKGGIKGYKIDIDWSDYSYLPNKAVDIYNGWKKDTEKWNKTVSIFGWGTADSVILSPEVAKDQKPYVSASYAGTLASPQPVNKVLALPDGSEYVVENKGAPYNFFAGTDYSTSIRLAMKFIKDSGGKKVVFIYCNAGYCKEPIPAGKLYAQELGLEIVGDIEVNLGDAAAQASDTIRKKLEEFQVTEADNLWAWIGNTTKTATFIAQGMAKHAPTNAKYISNVWGFDETSPGRCKEGWDGTSEPCVDRLFGVLPFAAFGELNYPGMKDLVVQHKKYRELDKEDTNLYADVRYVQGYVSFMIWRQAVEKLLNDNQEVTGPAIKSAFESFSTMSTQGLTLDLKFTPDSHHPSTGALIFAVGADGKLSYKKEVSVEFKPEWKGW